MFPPIASMSHLVQWAPISPKTSSNLLRNATILHFYKNARCWKKYFVKRWLQTDGAAYLDLERHDLLLSAQFWFVNRYVPKCDSVYLKSLAIEKVKLRICFVLNLDIGLSTVGIWQTPTSKCSRRRNKENKPKLIIIWNKEMMSGTSNLENHRRHKPLCGFYCIPQWICQVGDPGKQPPIVLPRYRSSCPLWVFQIYSFFCSPLIKFQVGGRSNCNSCRTTCISGQDSCVSLSRWIKNDWRPSSKAKQWNLASVSAGHFCAAGSK